MSYIYHKNLLNIFLCKDIEELKARLAFLVLEIIESKTYYDVGDSWIEDEKLQRKVINKILLLQENLLYKHIMLRDAIELLQENLNENYQDQYETGNDFIDCFIEFLQVKREIAEAQDILHNYPFEDDGTKKEAPYSDAYIKKWLKKKIE
jgi:hypothetical protein